MDVVEEEDVNPNTTIDLSHLLHLCEILNIINTHIHKTHHHLRLDKDQIHGLLNLINRTGILKDPSMVGVGMDGWMRVVIMDRITVVRKLMVGSLVREWLIFRGGCLGKGWQCIIDVRLREGVRMDIQKH